MSIMIQKTSTNPFNWVYVCHRLDLNVQLKRNGRSTCTSSAKSGAHPGIEVSSRDNDFFTTSPAGKQVSEYLPRSHESSN